MSQPRNKSNKTKRNNSKNKSNGSGNGFESPMGAGHGAPNLKSDDLTSNLEDSAGEFLTTNQGIRIEDNQNSLKAGDRGPSLLEDFILREKITHFDHERIPERVVHARGSAAHGYFQVYEPMTQYTRAHFLQDPSLQTPVFVRFSTVVGSRGSTDLARDVRGFAVKFYTQEGNFDLVGNNIPVFFIQDAIKFPDLVHAIKPEPHNEIPQAASAHDTFWDFISLMPESMHMIMWVMSDRAIPRSYRMMEGFGVHTFRFINDREKARFVKFHWKPLLGLHAVVWDEAQKISGKDPDFHRRDLWESIENGDYPEWELGVQIVEEKDEHSFDFDLLDPTKIIPEEIVPVQRIGRLTLNRNPENFFAETEQVAFHLGNIVPGIDFTNDPLLQGRLFSYLDTQLLRLGGPNFHEIPINRPVAPLHNNQRDGFMRQTINRGQTSYEPNSLRGGCPFQAGMDMSGFASYAERIDAQKIRQRNDKFFDHFSQATLFYRSQSEPEQNHIVRALRFELGKVETPPIRERMLYLLAQVDTDLANRVANGLGLTVPKKLDKPLNLSVPADGDPRKFQPKRLADDIEPSPALRMVDNPNFTLKSIRTRKVAFLVADGFNDPAVAEMKMALMKAGAVAMTVAPRLGVLIGAGGDALNADCSFLTGASVLFDAVYVPDGEASVAALQAVPESLNFLNEAYNHCKTIAASGAGVELLAQAGLPVSVSEENSENGSGMDASMDPGVIVSRDGDIKILAENFILGIARHRHWERELQLSDVSSQMPKAPPASKRARV
ncbi:MAG TPA: catalase [Pyrinomonadaceae bacterium]|nr:catalase [Pyrinomonadaceae bacterium]